jgi:hypothetical protein
VDAHRWRELVTVPIPPDDQSVYQVLVDAKLAGTLAEGGYVFRTNEDAASKALAVFAQHGYRVVRADEQWTEPGWVDAAGVVHST